MNECLIKLCKYEENQDDPLAADFRNLLWHIWTKANVVPGNPEPAPLQYDIADWMQNLPVASDGVARGQVQSMRGAGKTYIAAAFAVWLLYCNPNIRITILASTDDFAKRLVRFIRSVITGSDLFQHLIPRKADTSLDGKDQADNEKEFQCGGITVRSTEMSVRS